MDLKHIKNLIALMVENDLSQIEIGEGETHILLKRGQASGSGDVSSVLSASPATAGSANPAPSGAARSGAGARDTEHVAAEPTAPGPAQIRSPMVGTYYAGPDPESPPFVNVGDVVEVDTVVCLVEAMKVFNEIKAEVSGRLTKVLVRNAEAVEYDQPLFAVAPL